MKRIMALVVTIMLMLSIVAAADEIPPGEFVYMQDGDSIDRFYDEQLVISYKTKGMDYEFQVGDSEVWTDYIGYRDPEDLDDWDDSTEYEKLELFAVQFWNELYFFIGGDCGAGEYEYHVYELIDDSLYRMPGSFGCKYSTELRATRYRSFFADIEDADGWAALGTWTHEQEFVIASKVCEGNSEDEVSYLCRIFELPRGLYPFGRVVKITQDLPLLSSKDVDAEKVMLHEGEYAVVIGSDGEEWAYISQITEDNEDYDLTAGWMKFNPWIIDGQEAAGFDYMDGLWQQ